jgi:hypothetical protein
LDNFFENAFRERERVDPKMRYYCGAFVVVGISDLSENK